LLNNVKMLFKIITQSTRLKYCPHHETDVHIMYFRQNSRSGYPVHEMSDFTMIK